MWVGRASLWLSGRWTAMPIPSWTLRVLDAVIPPKRLLLIPAALTESPGAPVWAARGMYTAGLYPNSGA